VQNGPLWKTRPLDTHATTLYRGGGESIEPHLPVFD